MRHREPSLAAPTPTAASFGERRVSEQTVAMVSSAAKWMRVVSTFFYVFGGFAVLGTLGMLLMGLFGGMFSASAIPMALMATVVILGATWLRRAAGHFEQGLRQEGPSLAAGFRNLRSVFVLASVLGVLNVASSLIWLVYLGSNLSRMP
jgi:hypothetical protein